MPICCSTRQPLAVTWQALRALKQEQRALQLPRTLPCVLPPWTRTAAPMLADLRACLKRLCKQGQVSETGLRE